MSRLTTSADPSPESSRSGWLRVLLGGVALSQLFAFWLVCSHQVRLAEARQNEATIQQMAMSDCLQYMPGSTIASCNRIDVSAAATQPDEDGNTATTSAVPVSFSMH